MILGKRNFRFENYLRKSQLWPIIQDEEIKKFVQIEI